VRVATRTVVVLRDVADPPDTLAALTGCEGSARHTGDPLIPAIQAAVVDSVAEAAGRTNDGWLFVPPGIQASTRVWLGDDVVRLAQAVGEPVVAIGTRGEVWLGGPAGATRWFPIATPHGRTAWVMGADEVVGTGACPPWTVPSSISGLRSLTCAGVLPPSCPNLLPLVGPDATGVLQRGGDLMIAVPPCMDSHKCFAPPLTIVGTPAGWSGATSEIRAVGSNDSSGTLQPAPENRLPDYALDALGRPALPLPTGGEKAKLNTCSESLAGQLNAAPWDPRVAWVGDMPVVWPTGTVLRFLPLAEITTPGQPSGASAFQFDPVTLQGMLSASGLSFDACGMRSMRPAPASGMSGNATSQTTRP
jgi:hypothetical protein